MKITIRLIALVIIGSLMSTGVSAQNILNAGKLSSWNYNIKEEQQEEIKI